METGLLLSISMLACLVNGTVYKIFISKWNGHNALRYLYTLVTGVVSTIILLLWGGIRTTSFFTIGLGVVFGIITALQSIFLLSALRIGPYAYTTVITFLSTLIPALSGYLFWNEEIGISQIFGMFLLVVCLILSVSRSADEKSANARWIISCGLAFLCTGLIGVMQKIHQTSPHQDELNAFLIIAFLCSGIFSALSLSIVCKREGKLPFAKKDWILSVALLALAGVCIAVNNKLNLYLSGVIDSAVFFPLVNGGHLVLTTLVAVIFFHEKQTKKQWFGLITGIIAVVFLCNLF